MKYAKFCRLLKKYGEVDKSWAGITKAKNHTITLALRELKPIYKQCEFACGQEVANQHIEYKRVDHKHIRWLKKCASCGLYQNPQTGEMVDHRTLCKYFPNRIRDLSEED